MGVYIGAKIRGKFNSFGEIFVELTECYYKFALLGWHQKLQ
jgi:hypothetical protein